MSANGTPPAPGRRPMRASHFAVVVRRPVSILMATLAIVVFGWVSYERLPLTLMPDMSYPTLTVRTVYPGTAPEEIENIISRPLEQQLGIIPKLVSLSSVSKAGQSDVILEFQWKTDMDLVAQEVREKIDRLRLPDGAQRPLLLHYDPTLDPILRVGLAGPQSLYELRYIAENEVKRRLEGIPGVAAVQIKGGLEEQFLVALDENRITQLRLDIGQIAARLQQGNVNMPGGNLREGQTEYLIRTLNEFRTLEEIGSVIVARQNGADVRLRDIATVSRFHEDRQVITRVNGHESVEIEIYKEADANVLLVAASVKEGLFGTDEQRAFVAGLRAPAEPAPAAASTPEQQRARAQQLITRRQMTDFLSAQLPAGATLELLSDQSVFIDNSIREVKGNAIYGGLIAIAVLFLFLRNVTQTLIVSLCIPVSILATFAPMHLSGVSLNIISLGGLALGVGNLVDNAIVVLESIFRCREEGDDPVPAVVRGTSEVAIPVIASTLTTVAVFFPIVFVEGVAGQVFGDMALAVVFSQLASLIAALYLIPMLAAKLASPGGGAVGGGRFADAVRGSEGYFHLPMAAPGSSRGRGAAAYLLAGTGRVLLAVALALAALLKAVAALVAAVVWPLMWPVERLVRRVRRSRGTLAGVPGAGAWARLSSWLAADRLGRFESARVWPGLLGSDALARLSSGLRHAALWIAARRWRWILLGVVPALAVVAILVAVHNDPSLGQAGPKRPPGMPLVPGMPPPKPWWTWFFVHPWWQMVLAIPAVMPFAFVALRFVVQLFLRLSATLAQAALFALIQIALVTTRPIAQLLGPIAGVGLAAFEGGNRQLQQRYPDWLRTALRRRWAVLGSAALGLLATGVFVVPRLGHDLIPQVHQGEFNLDVTLPVGTPIERTADVSTRIEAVVRQQPEVERVATTVGAEEGATTSVDAGEHTAQLTVRLRRNEPVAAESALIDRIRGQFAGMPEVKIEVSYPALFSFKSPIEVEIRGHDLEALKKVSREAENLLSSAVPGLVDVRSSLQSGHPEIQIVYHRDRLAEYGLTLRGVAELVRSKVQGRAATQFRQEDQLIDVVVRLREQDRIGVEELRRLIVNPGGAVPIPLSAVADLTINEGPSQIRRVDQQRTAIITANLRGADLATVSRDIVAAMETLSMPPGFSYDLAGQNKEMQTSLNSLLLALGLAVFLVYIVMASQFESLVQPLLIMATVPLALVGVAAVLWIADIPVTIMVFLGLIILVGIVVNNAIVLIDYTNTLRSRGLDKTTAILEAGRARLRPILMTALTTVVGLVPMALGFGEGAEIRAPMAITVIVGLSTATVLTLIVIPTLYFQFTRADPASGHGVAAPDPDEEVEMLETR